MSTNISDVQDEQRPPAPDLSAPAEQLVSEAGTEGIELTGPAGLLTGLTNRSSRLTGLTKQVLETTLDVELGDRLGHDGRERSGSGNVRNGSGGKTVRTDLGEVTSRDADTNPDRPPTSCGNRREALADAEHRGASVGLAEAYMQGVVAGADSHPRAGTMRLR
jgi:hypothetical protein